MNAPVSVRVEQRIAFVAINNPPVNGLSHTVREGLFDAFNAVRSDDGIDGVVLHGHGPCFSAGGDIREFGTPAASVDPGLSKDVHPAIEGCGKTVVAAIHGYALGGGLETAMACHVRVAAAGARVGLPEARLGVIPLSGAQRLPRLIGVDAAIDMILTANDVRAEEAPAGLIDAIVEEAALLDIAARHARKPMRALVRERPFPADRGAFARARAAIAAGAYPPFAARLLDAMACGLGVSFDEGLRGARAIYDATVNSAASREARAAFLAARSAHSRKQTT
ncbi:MAG: enoyl-CoA hydratase/isomerase family protein [Hydrogenophilaceae bacterium]|jgi:3-hydroxyacyl-CoA dehydrogenase|nr:enoyl-CoA hydratase/isomerase family protein [Hydrogenophilaceae bacterium]